MWLFPGSPEHLGKLPRYSVADAQSYAICEQDMKELAAAAGLDVVSCDRYHRNYTDRSAQTAKATRWAWLATDGSKNLPNCMLEYLQNIMKRDKDTWEGKNFSFYMKTVSLVMVLKVAERSAAN